MPNINEEINYQYISERINKEAKYLLQWIKNKYYISFNDEKKRKIDQLLLMDNPVIVDLPTEENDILFEGRNNTPTAHGGRTKKDGLIHIYPYVTGINKTNQIIEYYINSGILLHEILHYFIQLDLKDDKRKEDQTDEELLGHFLTEGMVQLYTTNLYSEIYNRRIIEKTGYQKEVDLANELRNEIQNESLIFSLNYLELLNSPEKINEFINKYKKIQEFNKKLMEIFIQIDEDLKQTMDSNHNYKEKLFNRTKSMSIDETIEFMKHNTNIYYKDEMKKKEILSKISELENIFNKSTKINDYVEMLYELETSLDLTSQEIEQKNKFTI